MVPLIKLIWLHDLTFSKKRTHLLTYKDSLWLFSKESEGDTSVSGNNGPQAAQDSDHKEGKQMTCVLQMPRDFLGHNIGTGKPNRS